MTEEAQGQLGAGISGSVNHRRAAWLALFALFVQFALSFGHIHTEDFLPQSAASVTGPALPGSSGGPLPEGLAHEACAICASMHLAGALVLPEPIRLTAPAFIGETIAPLDSPFIFVAAPYRLFRTRAPPVI